MEGIIIQAKKEVDEVNPVAVDLGTEGSKNSEGRLDNSGQLSAYKKHLQGLRDKLDTHMTDELFNELLQNENVYFGDTRLSKDSGITLSAYKALIDREIEMSRIITVGTENYFK